MNRTAELRNAIASENGKECLVSIHCTGPYASFGREGEVSYTAYAYMTDEAKKRVCKRMEERSDVAEAYVTRRINGGYGMIGGNIKIVYHTRADGTPA